MLGSTVKFERFWQQYLLGHSRPSTRRLHFLGLGIAVVSLLIGIGLQNPVIAVMGLAMTYLLSWIGHFLFERNRPTVFESPVWSLLCDLRMCRLWLTGRLDNELRRVKANTAAEARP